jgi:hypothetical protein
VALKNLTLTVKEQSIRSGKIYAAQHGLSLSKVVDAYLSSLGQADDYERLLAEEDQRIESGAGAGLSQHWDREAAHQR